MTREEKDVIIKKLKAEIDSYNHFYCTDTSGLNASDTADLRRECFAKEIKLVVAKNTLLIKALEISDKQVDESLLETLKGNTSVMFTNTGNVPGKLIKEFRKKNEKPILKSAFVEEAVYIGDGELEALASIKSKEELIGDIVALLQSPAKNVISALKSGGDTLAGLVKTLSEKEEK